MVVGLTGAIFVAGGVVGSDQDRDQIGRRRRGRSSPAAIDRAEREREAIVLRRAGTSYEDIATRLGFADRSGAKKAVERGLSRWMRESDEELRAFELERTEALIARLWPLIDCPDPDLDVLAAYMRLVDYRAKIAGLYAPRRQQVEVAVRGRVEHRKIEAVRALELDSDVVTVVDEHVTALLERDPDGDHGH
jgi:hypothetical protein